jgi:hypothetical protein
MARTKTKARRDKANSQPGGTAALEDASVPTTPAMSTVEKKRPRMEEYTSSDSANMVESRQTKRAKATDSTPSTSAKSIVLPNEIAALSPAWTLEPISIISSSAIAQKVTRVLTLLGRFPAAVTPTDLALPPTIVYLTARAKDAAKLISVAEIAKRDLDAQGMTWFQYNCVGSVGVEEKSAEQKDTDDRNAADRNTGEEKDNGDGLEQPSFAFETMQTPLERALHGRSKIRAVPTMTLCLSRTKVDALKAVYGYVYPSPEPQAKGAPC